MPFTDTEDLKYYKVLVSSDDSGDGDKLIPSPRISSAQVQELREIDQKLSKCGRNKIDIRELSVEKAQKLFASKRLYAEELTRCYLRRIEAMNPILKAVTQINPHAIQDAIKADLDLNYHFKRGPLHGIPILIKDNIAVAGGMENTAGSPALLGLKPVSDARVIQKLRKAGAIILGKTNLSEFAYFRGTNIPSGWSGVGGQTVCPYNSSSDPSGSSSGSAVAVAANMALIALGTETDGSISSPSSRQSLFGLKSTLGLIPTEGVIPIAFSQDVVGPMARTAEDAEILFDAIRDKKFNLSDDIRCESNDLYCDPKDKLRIGALRQYFWDYKLDKTLAKEEDVLETALKSLESSDIVTVIDPAEPNPELLKDVSFDKEFIVLLHEFKYGINKYLQKEVKRDENLEDSVKSLADIIKYNINHNWLVPYNQKTLELAEKTDGILNTTYLSAEKDNRKGLKEYLDDLMDRHNLDMIVGPADPDLDIAQVCSLAAISGYPSLTVPAGIRSDGAPIGLTLIGKPYTEKVLFKAAKLMDSTRRSPKFL